MSNPDLAALSELLAKATPGNWTYGPEPNTGSSTLKPSMNAIRS